MSALLPDEPARTEVQHTARHLSGELFEEIQRIAAKLEASTPAFEAFFVIGSNADGDLDMAQLGSAWVCGSEISFALVTRSSILAPTLRCLQAGIGMRLGGMRVRLRHFRADYLTQQICKYREGFELMKKRKLVAGNERCLMAIDDSFVSRPAPAAAENLLIDSLELLLRAWPEAPRLARPPSDDARADLAIKGALIELTRDVGDALLLMEGRYACNREMRAKRLREIFPEPPARTALLDWAFQSMPLLEEAPFPFEQAWSELREAITSAVSLAVARRTNHRSLEPEQLIREVRHCRRSLLSRFRRLLKGKKRAGTREFNQLMLMLCLAAEDAPASKALLAKSAQLLPQLGGPILANPDWQKLRRESLLLEPSEHRTHWPSQTRRSVDAGSGHDLVVRDGLVETR